MTIPLIWIGIILVILALIAGLIGVRSAPSRVFRSGIGKLILENTSLGDRLSEIFYGVMMVSVVIGIINVFESGYMHIKSVLLIVAFGVNITWGIIDGATAVYGGLVDKAEEDRLVNSLRTDKENQVYKEDVKDILQGTILRKLSEEDQSKVVDMIQAEAPEKIGKYGASRDDLKVFLAILLMDFITVFPIIIPLYVVQGVQSAVFWSHLIAVLLFIIIGMSWAKYLNKNAFLAGIALGILGIGVIAFSFYFGW
jgi:VIT1/CCC1 family predicted Fe2+/Mn2+ transporter